MQLLEPICRYVAAKESLLCFRVKLLTSRMTADKRSERHHADSGVHIAGEVPASPVLWPSFLFYAAERVSWQIPLWISPDLFALGNLPIRLEMISHSRSVQRSNCRVRTGKRKTLKSSRPMGTRLQVRDNSAAPDVAGRGTLNPPPLKWVLQEGFASDMGTIVQKVRPPNCLHAEWHREVCIWSWKPTAKHKHQDTTALTKNLPWSTQISRGKGQKKCLCFWLSKLNSDALATALKHFHQHEIWKELIEAKL